MNDATSDDAGRIAACPHCDSPDVQKRRPRAGGGESAAAWYCRGCMTPVEAPVRRPRKREWTTRSGLAKRLAEADPDDVGGGGS